MKSEPHNEIPQAVSAHGTLEDFVSLQPEIKWLISDRALPRSYLSQSICFGGPNFAQLPINRWQRRTDPVPA